MSNRREVIEQLADLLLAIERDHPVRVAIDGVDAAGKTMLADELAPLIEARCRPVIRASIDGFHNPRALRYRHGSESPQGYYRDSFNHSALLRELLIPLGSGGNRIYRQKVFDYRVDALATEPLREAPVEAILVFDGVFLLRSELIDYWDFRIFVDVGFEVSATRAVQRDLRNGLGDSKDAIFARYQQRYVPSQRLYFKEAKPRRRADVIFDNNNIDNPTITLRSRNDHKPTN